MLYYSFKLPVKSLVNIWLWYHNIIFQLVQYKQIAKRGYISTQSVIPKHRTFTFIKFPIEIYFFSIK